MWGKKAANKALEMGVREEASAGPSEFGRRMLEKMGWAEGKGLGANEQGPTSHVRVVKKDNVNGLGASSKADEAKEEALLPAFDPLKAFEAAAAKVSIGGARGSGDENDEGDKDKDEDEDEDDEEVDLSNHPDLAKMSEADRKLFIACGGRRLGRRAGRPQLGKWRRQASIDGGVPSSSPSPSASTSPEPEPQTKTESESDKDAKRRRKEEKKRARENETEEERLARKQRKEQRRREREASANE